MPVANQVAMLSNTRIIREFISSGSEIQAKSD
jgi:hypothetical protein